MKSEYDDVDNWDVYRYEHVARIKSQARGRGIHFDLQPEDLTYPAICPILLIPITRKLKLGNHPAVDRVNNDMGYTKDNVRVISHKANLMKREHTVETFERFLKYVKGEI